MGCSRCWTRAWCSGRTARTGSRGWCCWRRCTSMRGSGWRRVARGRLLRDRHLLDVWRWRRRPSPADGPEQATWLNRLDAEYMNIRQALRWALDAEIVQEGLRLAGALVLYWHMRGYFPEGGQWLTEVLALPEAATRTTARAKALMATAFMRYGTRIMVGSSALGAEINTLLAEAVSIARETGDKWVLSAALNALGGRMRARRLSCGPRAVGRELGTLSRTGRPGRHARPVAYVGRHCLGAGRQGGGPYLVV